MGDDDGNNNREIIAALDVGSSSVRCQLYDHQLHLIRQVSRPLHLIDNAHHVGWVEYDAEALWKSAVECMEEAFAGHPRVSCLGITAQRNTFLVFDAETCAPVTNFVSWQDLRAAELVKETNASWALRCVNAVGYLLHAMTGSKMFLSARILKFSTPQVGPRLAWLMQVGRRFISIEINFYFD